MFKKYGGGSWDNYLNIYSYILEMCLCVCLCVWIAGPKTIALMLLILFGGGRYRQYMSQKNTKHFFYPGHALKSKNSIF